MATIGQIERYERNLLMGVKNIAEDDCLLIITTSGKRKMITLADLRSAIATNYYVADFATFNSDLFLSHLCSELGGSYGYEVISCSFNGETVANGDPVVYTSPDTQIVPVQVAPYVTIPAHTSTSIDSCLNYDANWIAFLNSLPIASMIGFRVSPFKGNTTIPDMDWPLSLTSSTLGGSMTPVVIDGDSSQQYGEGFQIIWPKGASFRIEIKYNYFNSSSASVTDGHTLIFTHEGYSVDGASETYANLTEILL